MLGETIAFDVGESVLVKMEDALRYSTVYNSAYALAKVDKDKHEQYALAEIKEFIYPGLDPILWVKVYAPALEQMIEIPIDFLIKIETYKTDLSNCTERKKNMSIAVHKIVYNGDTTVVYWKDGTRTIVHKAEGEEDNKYHAFCAALAKKVYGSNAEVNRIVCSGIFQHKRTPKKKKKEEPQRESRASLNCETIEETIEKFFNRHWNYFMGREETDND